jgi:LuxR family quorum sensing-dependent transcriptional regulator
MDWCVAFACVLSWPGKRREAPSSRLKSRPSRFIGHGGAPLPNPGSSKPQQESHVILHEWPSGWWERYFSSGYLFADPAIQRVTSDISPFLWSELKPLCRDDPMATRVMNEAGDFRLKTGFTVPLVTLEGDIAGFSIAGERLEMPPYTRGMLTLLATYALGRTLQLRINNSDAKLIGITDREREVLQWAAVGKTE